MDHRPSVIAAAAVLAAFDGQLTRKTMDCKMSVISLWGSRENVSFFFLVNHQAMHLCLWKNVIMA